MDYPKEESISIQRVNNGLTESQIFIVKCQHLVKKLVCAYRGICTGQVNTENEMKMIDSCQAHLPMQFALNIKFIRQM